MIDLMGGSEHLTKSYQEPNKHLFQTMTKAALHADKSKTNRSTNTFDSGRLRAERDVSFRNFVGVSVCFWEKKESFIHDKYVCTIPRSRERPNPNCAEMKTNAV
jgi:hypothetical protein